MMLIKFIMINVKFMIFDNDFCKEYLFILVIVLKYYFFVEIFLYLRVIV